MSKTSENAERLKQVLTVAKLFYEEEMTKTDISHVIKASTTQVARLLEEAKKEGYVKVDIRPPVLEDLADRLKSKFNWLQHVTVIIHAADYNFLRRMLGRAAAEYFEDNVVSGTKIAIGGGDMIYEMIMALPERERDIIVSPAAIVDSGPALKHIDPIVNVSLLWAKSGRQKARAHIATGLPPNKPSSRQEVKKEYDAFGKRKAVLDVLSEAESADFIFAGIGCLRKEVDKEEKTPQIYDYPWETAKLTEAILDKEGGIGDINYNIFNSRGETTAEWDMFPGLGVEKVKKAVQNGKHVVVTASKFKLPALKAGLRGRLFNVLLTDEVAALKLLNYEIE